MIIKSPAEAFKSFTEGSPLKVVHGDPSQVKGFMVAVAMIAGMSGMAMSNNAEANPLGVSTQYSQPGEAPQFMKDAGSSIKSGATSLSDKVSGAYKDMKDSQKGGYDPKADVKTETKTSSLSIDTAKDVASTAVGVSVGAPLVAVGKGLQWMVNKAQATTMEKKPEQPAPQAPKF